MNQRITVTGVLLLVVLVSGLAFYHLILARSGPSIQIAAAVEEPSAFSPKESSSQTVNDASIRPQNLSGAAANPLRREVVSAAVPKMSPPLAPSASSQELIERISNIKLQDGKLTSAQAQQLKSDFERLVQQGPAALSAIRDFLAKNQDLNFGDEGVKLVGAPSIRTGLIDALRQIGGPGAIELSRQVLQSTAVPLEIAALSRNLDEAAPGQYRQESLEAAQQTLADAAMGKLDLKDVGPLFQVLQTYGDATVAADLEKYSTKWGCYVVMALAGLPNGQGIPVLSQLALDTTNEKTGNGRLAFRLLAQSSAQYPEAAASLVDLAQQSKIPESSWNSIAEGLGGQQYSFEKNFPDKIFTSASFPSQTLYRSADNYQTYITAPLPASTPVEQINQRLAVLNQLLALNPGSAAVDALQKAKASLTAKP